MLILSDLKHLWGRLVFRYAGRNICAENTARTRKFYNLIGKLYDWLYADQIYGYRQAAQFLVDRYVNPGDWILDIGCGTGLLMAMAQEKAGFLVGIDLSLGMLKQARNKLCTCDQAHLIAADCRALPLSKSFDKILSSFMLVILNQEDQQRVVCSLSSLLNEEGALVFLSSRDNFSPEWLTVEQWHSNCTNAGLSHVEIFDLYDYYRIVVAEKVRFNPEWIESSVENSVASRSAHT